MRDPHSASSFGRKYGTVTPYSASLVLQQRFTFVLLYGHAGMHAWVQGTPPGGSYYLPSEGVVELRPLVEVAVTLAKPPAPVAAPAPPGKSSIAVSF